MIYLKRKADAATGDWLWYWENEQSRRAVSPIFASQEFAIAWANQHWDKETFSFKEEAREKWSGVERRTGVADRRTGIDRRTELRFSLENNDRRKSVGRRAYDQDTWRDVFKR